MLRLFVRESTEAFSPPILRRGQGHALLRCFRLVLPLLDNEMRSVPWLVIPRTGNLCVIHRRLSISMHV